MSSAGGDFFNQEFPAYHVWALIRIFEKRSYLEDFLAGRIRLGTLGAYRGWELGDASGRRDTWEGFGACFQPHEIELTFDGHRLASDSLIQPVLIHPEGVDGWNVCSFVAPRWPRDQPIEEEPSTVLDWLRLSKDVCGLGEHVAVVIDAEAFLEAVSQKVSGMGFVPRYGPVEYFDGQTVSGGVPPERVGFFKRRDAFAHQGEFRIVVQRENPDEEILWVDISDLGEFALGTTVDEFNRKIDLKIPDEDEGPPSHN